MTTNSVLIVLIIAVLVIMAVLAFNIYTELQYRKRIHAQFGHSDKDSLLQSKAREVRDGTSNMMFNKLNEQKTNETQDTKTEETFESLVEEKNDNKVNTIDISTGASLDKEEDEELDEEAKIESFDLPVKETATTVGQVEKIEKPAEPVIKAPQKPLINLEELKETEFAWFNPNFDYMAYISLYQARELSSIPRLSSNGRHQFRIAGCTKDGQYQLAEPIPGVQYQAFVIGLQAINRSGLTSSAELVQFGNKVKEFAAQMHGEVALSDVQDFLRTARPLDELCERVDQVIAIHLVSRDTITGMAMRNTLEKNGFRLAYDGVFHYPDVDNSYFTIVDLEGKSFTSERLITQTFRGFSLLFDITKVPFGDKHFMNFMDLTVSFSHELVLDIVNDKFEELSTEWLQNIGDYIHERQAEMKAAGIIPGEELAQRLFS